MRDLGLQLEQLGLVLALVSGFSSVDCGLDDIGRQLDFFSGSLLGDSLLGDSLLGDSLLGDSLLGDSLLGNTLGRSALNARRLNKVR
jgi:hypothetical protein